MSQLRKIGRDLQNQNNRSVLPSDCISYCAVLTFGLLLFLLINTLNINRIESNAITALTTGSGLPADSELPLCTGNLLHQEELADVFHDGRCRLLTYTVERIVTCLDFLNYRGNDSSSTNVRSANKELHFVFMGDSRMRQQFLNFIKLIPDNDRKSNPSVIPSRFHYDIVVTSRILGLRVSFKWRPLIDNNVTETLRQWASLKPSERPYFICLSIVVWHMLRGHGADFQFYQEKLAKIAPTLGELAMTSQVIWLNQYPTKDFNVYYDELKSDIDSVKIHHYNEAIRRILGVYPGIKIWDSSNKLAEEYIRSCAILERDEWNNSRTYDSIYFNCNDFIHTGYSALSQATQLLLNDICNVHITQLETQIHFML